MYCNTFVLKSFSELCSLIRHCWRFFYTSLFKLPYYCLKSTFKTLRLMVFLPSNLGFLFLSRCLIFKVQSPSLFARQLKEYITSHSLCQYFFQSFFNFFRINLFVLPQDRPRRMLAYIITSFCFCQQFLTTFFGYFNELHAFLHSLPGVFVCNTIKATICCVWFLFVSVLSICGVDTYIYINTAICIDCCVYIYVSLIYLSLF